MQAIAELLPRLDFGRPVLDDVQEIGGYTPYAAFFLVLCLSGSLPKSELCYTNWPKYLPY